MIQSVFAACSSLLSVYSFICLIRIFMTWVPQFENSQVGRFIASLCDPYLNWFRRFSFTRVGMVDFSPILALGVLSVASMSFSTLAATGRITVGIILAGLLQVLWSFFSFFLNILILFLIIRLIYDLVNRYGFSQFWTMLDRFLNPPISWVTKIFFRGKITSYRFSLIFTLAITIAVRVGLGYAMVLLRNFLYNLPF